MMGLGEEAARRPCIPGQRVNPGDVRDSPQLQEHVAGRLQLQPRPVVVPQGAARQPHQRPHDRDLIRCLELLPHLAGVSQRDQGGSGVAFGQLAAGIPSWRGLARGQHDLHIGGQQPCAFKLLGGLAHHPADRRGGRVGAPLGQP